MKRSLKRVEIDKSGEGTDPASNNGVEGQACLAIIEHGCKAIHRKQCGSGADKHPHGQGPDDY